MTRASPNFGHTTESTNSSWLPLIVICLAQMLAVLNPAVINTTIAGIGTAILVPSLLALIVANYQGKQQALAVGFLGAASGIGVGLFHSLKKRCDR
jgi:hypothetical protein